MTLLRQGRSGSALHDQIVAETLERRASWRAPPSPPPMPALPEYVPLPEWNIKPVEERLNEAEALRGQLGWDKFRKIENGIIGSALDLREPRSGDPPKIRKPLRIVGIQELTAWYYGVTSVDMLGNRHKARIVRPRQVAMYLARVLRGDSYSEIGRRFGGRDHATVFHAAKKIGGLIDGTRRRMGYEPGTPDLVLAEEIVDLKRMLLG